MIFSSFNFNSKTQWKEQLFAGLTKQFTSKLFLAFANKQELTKNLDERFNLLGPAGNQ